MKRVIIFFFFLIYSLLYVHSQVLVVCGEKISEVEKNAVNDLIADLNKAQIDKVTLKEYTKSLKSESYNFVIYVGTTSSNSFLQKCVDDGCLKLIKEKLQPETFVLESLNDRELVIAGADVRGLFYGIYHFSETALGIDPFEYWTDIQPKPRKLALQQWAFRETPPVFPLRGYFDNDNDLLANYKGKKLIIELDTWKEMINSLARLRYNYIDIHDLLGRPEYYMRDYYKKLTEYHSDLNLIEQVIDYAHSKGMLVQIPMYLGWEFHHMDIDKVCLSKHYEHWIEIYEYYMTKTPLGKADIYLQRPRHPYYDWKYYCEEEEKAGLKAGELMNKMFLGLDSIIQKYRPGATLFCDLWHEGRDLWNAGEFAPKKNINMLWADAGFADFGEFPTDLQGYDFGIYIHAGVWKNNVTQDPYPHKIKNGAMEALKRNMTSCYFVNGQTFKDFLLNIEAAGRVAWDPQRFDSEAFYIQWNSRYFGEENAEECTRVFKMMHESNQPTSGFRDIMSYTVGLLNSIEKQSIRKKDVFMVEHALLLAENAYRRALAIEGKVTLQGKKTFNEQLLFPTRIFKQNLEMYLATIHFNNLLYKVNQGEVSVNQEEFNKLSTNLKKALDRLCQSLTNGTGWNKWENFYLPQNFRIHTPPPTKDKVDKVIEDAVKKINNKKQVER